MVGVGGGQEWMCGCLYGGGNEMGWGWREGEEGEREKGEGNWSSRDAVDVMIRRVLRATFIACFLFVRELGLSGCGWR